jgi:hypothetical protein
MIRVIPKMLLVKRLKWKPRYVATKAQYLNFSDKIKYQLEYFTVVSASVK